MAEEVFNLTERIIELKENLVKGKTPDKNNRYSLKPHEFTDYFSRISDLYKSFLEHKKAGGEVIEAQFIDNKIVSPLDLKNLKVLTFDWVKVYKPISQIKDFYTDVLISELTFENCEFTFVNLTYFNQAEFSPDLLLFNKCKLHEVTCSSGFENLSKNLTLQFLGCELKSLFFNKIKEIPICLIALEGTTIKNRMYAKSGLDFRGLSCRNCILIEDSDALYPTVDFGGSNFVHTLEFVKCTFNVVPRFHDTTFHTGTTFQGSKFKNYNLSGVIGDYRRLKQAMHDLGAEQEAHIFHAHEMNAIRVNTYTYTLAKLFKSENKILKALKFPVISIPSISSSFIYPDNSPTLQLFNTVSVRCLRFVQKSALVSNPASSHILCPFIFNKFHGCFNIAHSC